MTLRPLGTAGLLILALLPAAAGSADGAQAPPSWRWVTDQPAKLTTVPTRMPDSAFTFVRMLPGWHIAMGPGGVLFDPRYFTEGTFALEAEIFHFPNSDASGEYGFFVGGTDVEGSAPRYASFVLRGDGSVAAWERKGGVTRSLAEWRRADAVMPTPTTGKDPSRNVVRLVVSKKEVVLKANGLDALVVPRENLPLDGLFGFRVGRGVNLHVSSMSVTSRMAPTRD